MRRPPSLPGAIADFLVKLTPGYGVQADAYLTMLSSGSSKYPIDLLKDAGVDMTTSQPFNAAIQEMNQVIDQIEAILKKQGK